MSNSGRWSEDVTVRAIPKTRLVAMGWLVFLLVMAGVIGWELQMRSIGLEAGDLDDSRAHWAVERRKIAAGAEPVLATIYMIKVGVLITGIVATHWMMRERELEQVVSRTPWWLTGLVCAAMLFAVIVTQDSATAFIYFQF